MPTYEYACTSCGERTEARQKFSDPPLTECPHCGGSLRKLYSPVGIVFKGSGFYSTDAKKGAKSASSEKSSTQSRSGDSKSSETKSSGETKSSSETKPSSNKPTEKSA